MSMSIGRLVIPAIIISAFLVAASATFTMALQQGDTSGAYRPGDLTGSKGIGASGTPEGVAEPGAGTELGPAQDQCYRSCKTDTSGIMKSLCSLGCGYLAGPPPIMP